MPFQTFQADKACLTRQGLEGAQMETEPRGATRICPNAVGQKSAVFIVRRTVPLKPVVGADGAPIQFLEFARALFVRPMGTQRQKKFPIS